MFQLFYLIGILNEKFLARYEHHHHLSWIMVLKFITDTEDISTDLVDVNSGTTLVCPSSSPQMEDLQSMTVPIQEYWQ